jgi:hypothetical protein
MYDDTRMRLQPDEAAQTPAMGGSTPHEFQLTETPDPAAPIVRSDQAAPSIDASKIRQDARQSQAASHPLDIEKRELPSNRLKKFNDYVIEQLASRTDGTFGVDRLCLGFPLDPNSVALSLEYWKSTRGGRRAVLHPLPSSDRCAVTVTLWEHPNWKARMDFNPSRVYDPEGTSLCPPGLLRYLVERLVRRMAVWFWPDGATIDEVTGELRVPPAVLDQMKLSRVDLARDYATEDAAKWVSKAEHCRPAYGKQWTHGGRGPGRTAYLGAKRDFFRVYDKHIQSKRLAPAGQVRAELELKGGWRGDVTTLGKLTPLWMAWRFAERWVWSGLGDPIAAGHPLEALLALDLSAARKAPVMGSFWAEECGRDIGLPKHTMNEHRRHWARAGAVPGLRVAASSVRLDLETGREVECPTPPV